MDKMMSAIRRRARPVGRCTSETNACYHAGMTAQVTWRAPEELVERVRAAAIDAHYSLNQYITVVLDAATNPDHAGSDAERIRERLARAGLLARTEVPRVRPNPDELAEARAAAATGTPAAELISADRG
jgi:hypothetical protein